MSTNINSQETEKQGDSAENMIEKVKKSEKSVKHYQFFLLRLLILIIVIWLLFFKIIGLTHMPSSDMYPRIDGAVLSVG